jgi:AraC-like DNA-binding protein
MARRPTPDSEMALDVKEFRAGDADTERHSLFESVRRFRFAVDDGGFPRTTSASLGSVTVAEVRSAGHDVHPEAVAGATFIAPMAGRIAVSTRQGALDAQPGRALLLRPGGRETSVRAEPGRAFRALVAIAVDPGGDGARVASGAALAADASVGLPGFLDYFLREAAQPRSPLLRPSAMKSCEALILDGFAALNRFDAPLEAREAQICAARVRAAEAYIRAHSDLPLTVSQIADAVGIGARSLQAAFRDSLGVTPRERLTELRFERARARLLSADATTTVSGAALDSGFAHLGRFSVEYRQRYGESPSDTLARARGAD